MLKRLNKARNFNEGFATVEYTICALGAAAALEFTLPPANVHLAPRDFAPHRCSRPSAARAAQGRGRRARHRAV
eukprot:1388651-Prymnesium_polylepis.1